MKIAFPTDEHVPFQDDKARQIALQIIRDFNPDLMAAGSDGLDFYTVSSFDKNPERIKVSLQKEIDQWKTIQREWRDAAPGAKRVFIPGNHEDRLRKYLWRHPELADLEVLALPNLLGLASLGIEWMYDGSLLSQEYVVDNVLAIKHGQYVRKGSGMSARAEIEHEHYSISTISGHTHRGGSFYATTRHGVVQGHEAFCLCRLDPEYLQHPDWQQGLLLAEIVGENLEVELIPFNDFRHRKSAIWRGKEYSAA